MGNCVVRLDDSCAPLGSPIEIASGVTVGGEAGNALGTTCMVHAESRAATRLTVSQIDGRDKLVDGSSCNILQLTGFKLLVLMLLPPSYFRL